MRLRERLRAQLRGNEQATPIPFHCHTILNAITSYIHAPRNTPVFARSEEKLEWDSAKVRASLRKSVPECETVSKATTAGPTRPRSAAAQVTSPSPPCHRDDCAL